MKITSIKYLYPLSPPKKTALNMFLECILQHTPPKKQHYVFKATVDNSNNIQEGDEVLMAEGIKLIVLKKFSCSSIVLRTKELHYEIPFLGIELALIAEQFQTERCIVKDIDTSKCKSQPCSLEFNKSYCKKCLMNISGEHIHSFCKQGYWNTLNNKTS